MAGVLLNNDPLGRQMEDIEATLNRGIMSTKMRFITILSSMLAIGVFAACVIDYKKALALSLYGNSTNIMTDLMLDNTTFGLSNISYVI